MPDHVIGSRPVFSETRRNTAAPVARPSRNRADRQFHCATTLRRGEQVGDGLGVVGVGLEREVKLERIDGLPDAVELEADHAEVALLLGIFGGDRGQPALDVQRGRKSCVPRLIALRLRSIRVTIVRTGRVRAGSSESSTGRRVTSDSLLLAALPIEHIAGMERVDEQVLLGVPEPQHEMGRQVDALEGQSSRSASDQ